MVSYRLQQSDSEGDKPFFFFSTPRVFVLVAALVLDLGMSSLGDFNLGLTSDCVLALGMLARPLIERRWEYGELAREGDGFCMIASYTAGGFVRGESNKQLRTLGRWKLKVKRVNSTRSRTK